MATAPTPIQDVTILTKPADWAIFMVDAALTIIAHESDPPIRYTSEDAGKFELLNTLNYLEAHGEYSWPRFEAVGYYFDQTMRFRRSLVTDILGALVKIGKVELGNLDGRTEGSMAGTRGQRVRNGLGASTGTKRLCNAHSLDQASSDIGLQSSSSTIPSDSPSRQSWFDDKNFLASAMKLLIDRSKTKVDHLHGVKDAEILADVVLENFSRGWGEHPVPGVGGVIEEASHVSESSIADRDRNDGDDYDDSVFESQL